MLALLAGGLLAGCGTSTMESSAGEGLSAVARGGTTYHGAEAGPGPDTRPGNDQAAILPTPRVWVQPHPPRPVEARGDRTLYRSQVDVINRGAVAVRVPLAEVETVVRAGPDRLGCELQAVASTGIPRLRPGERRTLEFDSLCPMPADEHEVISYVELPELLGEDGLFAGRTIVAEPRRAATARAGSEPRDGRTSDAPEPADEPATDEAAPSAEPAADDDGA